MDSPRTPKSGGGNMRTIDPHPIDSPSKQYSITRAPARAPPNGDPPLPPNSGPPPTTTIPLRPAPDMRPAPEMRPGSGLRRSPRMPGDFPPPTGPMMEYPRPPMQMQTPMAPTIPLDINSVKTNAQRNLEALIQLRRQRLSFGASSSAVDLEWQIRNQTSILLGDLKTLQGEVRSLAKAAQNHRWRRWLLGGFIAAFIPLVRKLWRRGGSADKDSRLSSNNTEYAFRKAREFLTRIRESVQRYGHWASMAFFVFSVLYVFQNEVTLRVAKTVQKRIRKLVSRIEYGDETVDEKDLKVLEGWRWRVMLW